MTLDVDEFSPFDPCRLREPTDMRVWCWRAIILDLWSHTWVGSIYQMTYVDWMTCITLFNLLMNATNIVHVIEKMCVSQHCNDEQIVISVPKMSLICVKAMLTHCDIIYNVLFYLKLHALMFAHAYTHSSFPSYFPKKWLIYGQHD